MSAAERDPHSPEIRAWANENGWDLKPAGRIPAAARSAWATANAGGLDRGPAEPPSSNGHDHGGPITFTIPDYPPLDEAESDAEPIDAPVRPPQPPPRRSAAEQLRERFRRRPAPARPARRRRVTLENLGGLAWAGAAQLAARFAEGRFAPVAICMSFQAPVVGLVAEDALKNTPADRVLQVPARLIEAGSDAGALLGPPALVALVCARPEMYPVARPLLAAAMKQWIIVAGPKLRELRRREEKFKEEMEQLGEEYEGFGIEEMIDAIFAPMMPGPDAMRSGPPGPETPDASAG